MATDDKRVQQETKTMRKKMLGGIGLALIAIAVALPATLEAQRRQGGPPSLDEQIAALKERLELSEEQVIGVREILEQQNDKRREIFQGGGGDRSAMRAAMEEIREETATMLGEVLDEDQMAEYAKIQEERRQRRRPPPTD